ncbi:hypothetical protein JG688_00012344 [Phytophthora aleatoria]|uniref:Uncharacterized protein n=1 Tax=Phytophthora aleatoria TaxID=2496075 RepID=A0A8J5IJ89_9STRA|nr:hypothetical protein JG688_00012344 [Phytophthora aleatoria]
MSVSLMAYEFSSLYCAFSNEKSPACDELNLGNYEGGGIIYQRDQYWIKSAIVPSQASVLLFSSKLDPEKPHKYAEYLLDALDGSNKELVTRICGMELLVSYVTNNGELQQLDRLCMGKMSEFDIALPAAFAQSFFSTDEAYDGVYNASLSQTEESA